jgi:lysine-N-methylase
VLHRRDAGAARISCSLCDALHQEKESRIHLPVFQRFDCQSCTYCCRNLVVNVSEKDRRRIIAAGWEQRLAGEPLFVEYRFGGRQLFHLARRPDGACVFLGPDNLCRIHAETGAANKPLACRAYPFVATPGADAVRIDVRLDCPSAAANKGRPLAAHAVEIARIAGEADIDRGMTRMPTWPKARELAEDEFIAVGRGFESIMRTPGEPLRTRLRAGCHLLDLLYAARIEKVRKLRFIELIQMLSTAALEEARENTAPPPLAGRPARLFRQWLFLHMFVDDPDVLNKGRLARLRSSWRRYGYARRFSRGSGTVPPMRPDWPETTFEAVAAVGTAADEAWEPLERAILLKLDAHAFAGPGYFGYDLIAGLTALWLMPAVVAWLSRLAAVAAGKPAVGPDEVLAGLRQAHHTFGVSPVFAGVSEALRLRSLARPSVPASILATYGP